MKWRERQSFQIDVFMPWDSGDKKMLLSFKFDAFVITTVGLGYKQLGFKSGVSVHNSNFISHWSIQVTVTSFNIISTRIFAAGGY